MTTQTKEVKHTPGPWNEYRHSYATLGCRGPLKVETKTSVIAEVMIADSPEEQEANAHLIAAAPELLARLEQVLPYLYKMQADGVETVKPVQMMIEQAKAAIAKATK